MSRLEEDKGTTSHLRQNHLQSLHDQTKDAQAQVRLIGQKLERLRNLPRGPPRGLRRSHSAPAPPPPPPRRPATPPQPRAVERQFAEGGHLPLGALFGPWDARVKAARQMHQLVDAGHAHFLVQRRHRLAAERRRLEDLPPAEHARRLVALWARYGEPPPAPAHPPLPPSGAGSAEQRTARYYSDAQARYQQHTRDEAERQRIHSYHPYPLDLRTWQRAETRAHSMPRDYAEILREHAQRELDRKTERHYQQQHEERV